MNEMTKPMTRERLLKTLQSHALALHETALYLDTHPKSRPAQHYFAKMQEAVRHLTSEYEEKYGPLTAFSADAENGWKWVDSPWPWQDEDALPRTSSFCDTASEHEHVAASPIPSVSVPPCSPNRTGTRRMHGKNNIRARRGR